MSYPVPPSVSASLTLDEPVFHIAFYKFVRLVDPQATVGAMREITKGLTGSVLIASEGINGMLAGAGGQLDRFAAALESDGRFAGAFGGMVYKRTACAVRPFGRMKVHLKKEIVPLGVDGVDASRKSGINVSPKDWRELIARDDVVVIDNRNSFEYRMGRFANAIDPEVTNFRDFPKYIEEHLPIWQAEGKKVAMYCTGGIRCEKTSAWMADLGVPVYQLEGGILNYFAQMPDADADWQGDCFVFDNRVALNTRLQQTGVTPEEAYAEDPDAQWRIARAKRLEAQA